ncbi:LOW QUALITY PROTEIN: E3 ubiquitin/ISG15 ligase TRIM25-like [Pristis pectinata]|uniref:LOW QUALITY PROTEIN: E3 ubiquitin/ISG15 ligase TRIM25-like n=1 Tax=Pristis pectinata TaxID=685728 RepID=UPI00223E1E81|nr:LOW QUALITY PROTEIN: E3 ubiquitin/ISG15 ligase TRIM25-like [Pristis pectinata]
MAVSKVSISEAKLCCAICLDLLKSPATIPCGHNFCMECIGRCWHQDGASETFRCPQCRETFNSRPSLSKNTILCEIVEDFTNSDPSPASEDATGPQDVLCDFCTDQKLEAVKSCVVCMASYCQLHLQPHASNPVFKDHRLINPIKDIEGRKCPNHRKPLEVFCRTDQTCVCCLCAINEHRQHETVSLEEQVSELKKELCGRQGRSGHTDRRDHRRDRKAETKRSTPLTISEYRIQSVQWEFDVWYVKDVAWTMELTGCHEGLTGDLGEGVDGLEDFGMVLQVKQQAKQKCAELQRVVEKAQRDVLRFLEEEEGAMVSQMEESMTQLQDGLAGLQQSRLQLEAALKSDDSLFVLQLQDALQHCQCLQGTSRHPPRSLPTDTGHEDALHLTFDLNTAHKHLLLSEDNRTVTDVDPTVVPYPEHQERFNNFPQVLCAQSISEGCCYCGGGSESGHWAGIGSPTEGQ